MLPRLKTLIVDDRQTDREILQHLLNQHPLVFNIHTVASSFDAAKDILARECFDLSILDIKLDHGKDVLDLFQSANWNHLGIISIMSEHLAELPKRGLVVNSPINIGKPFVAEDIDNFKIRVLERWEKVLKNNEARFIIVGATDSRSVLRRKIYFFKAKKNITSVCFEVSHEEKPKRYLILDHHHSLGRVEKELRAFSNFIKTDRSFIINTEFDLKYQSAGRGLTILFRAQDEFYHKDLEVIADASESGKKLLIARGLYREYGR